VCRGFESLLRHKGLHRAGFPGARRWATTQSDESVCQGRCELPAKRPSPNTRIRPTFARRQSPPRTYLEPQAGAIGTGDQVGCRHGAPSGAPNPPLVWITQRYSLNTSVIALFP